jgi:anti-anti-sigma factor
MNFDIKTEQLGNDAYVISLAGEVDLYTAPEFKQQLLEVIGQGGKQVVVDFSNTTFIDSTTLGVLVGGVKRLRTNDGQLPCLQRPEHHEDLRDHRSRPRLHDLPDPRRGRVQREVGRNSSRVGLLRRLSAAAGGVVVLLLSACGTGVR